MLTNKDKEILRSLATQYMEIASLPAQQEKVKLWKALNSGNMIRPMVVLDQLPWHEYDSDDSLHLCVEDTVWRGVEQFLRQTVYRWENFPADMVVEPFIPIPMAVNGYGMGHGYVIGHGYGIEIQEETIALDKRSDIVSHNYKNQFIYDEDIAKIKDIQISHDKAETENRLMVADELFSGIVPFKASGIQFHLGMWDFLAQYMGVTDIYTDIVERPEFIHSLIRRITDSTIQGIKQANELNLHDGNANTCHCSYVYTDELLPGPGENKGMKSHDTWAFGMAQLFTSVSPAMTEEFEIVYFKELAEYFGGIYYGCCERMDDRLEYVLQIPNLRKVSCSPWSNRDAFAERIGSKLTMSAKPAPSFLATDSVNYDNIEDDLRQTIKTAKRYNVNLELILKDVSTVRYDPKRLNKWNEIAMRLVEDC